MMRTQCAGIGLQPICRWVPTGGTSSLPPAMEPIRVMVVDDAADARLLIRISLAEHAGMAVIAEAAGADAALEALDDAAPHVALLDARMPVVDGFELTAALLERRPDLRIAILTSMVD